MINIHSSALNMVHLRRSREIPEEVKGEVRHMRTCGCCGR